MGCKLTVFKRMFELTDADEYTYLFMENNKHIFIMADADAILSSLRGQVRDCFCPPQVVMAHRLRGTWCCNVSSSSSTFLQKWAQQSLLMYHI